MNFTSSGAFCISRICLRTEESAIFRSATWASAELGRTKISRTPRHDRRQASAAPSATSLPTSTPERFKSDTLTGTPRVSGSFAKSAGVLSSSATAASSAARVCR
eukprot:GHVT01020494.1.p2 GENE.GHVT01020494.1~~GHVT01020494.1.p2  ORF type:complete len:122 (+),score=22.64 GHVT01020494.1:54-368(+)